MALWKWKLIVRDNALLFIHFSKIFYRFFCSLKLGYYNNTIDTSAVWTVSNIYIKTYCFVLSLSKVCVHACVPELWEYGSAGITLSASDPFQWPVLRNGIKAAAAVFSHFALPPASGHHVVVNSHCVEVCVMKDKLLSVFDPSCVTWQMKLCGLERLPHRLGRWMSAVF